MFMLIYSSSDGSGRIMIVRGAIVFNTIKDLFNEYKNLSQNKEDYYFDIFQFLNGRTEEMSEEQFKEFESMF